MKHNFIREKVVEEDVEMDGSEARHVPEENKIEEEIEAMENMTRKDEKLAEAEERSAHPSVGPFAESKVGKIAVINMWRFVSPSMGKVNTSCTHQSHSQTDLTT